MLGIEDAMEIKKRLWEGSINLKIVYSDQGHEAEFLIAGFRNSYLPLLYPKIRDYFQLILKHEISNAIWLEYEGVPLKWNLPIGVLYDKLYLAAHYHDRSSHWTLDLKLDANYPSEYIIPFMRKNKSFDDANSIDYLGALNEVLMNQLKQSCFVANGTAKPIMQLSEKNSERLRHSIQSRNLYDYESVNKKTIKQQRSLPVKLFLPGDKTAITVSATPTQLFIEFLEEQIPPDLVKISRAIVHGVDAVALHRLPLLKIWQIFKHLDNVLYINIIML